MLFILCAIASVIKFAFCGDTVYLVVASLLCIAGSIQLVFDQFRHMIKSMLIALSECLDDIEKKKQEAKMERAKGFAELAKLINEFNKNH